MPSEVALEVEFMIPEDLTDIFTQMASLTPKVLEKNQEVHFFDYWGNVHARVKVTISEGYVTGSLDDDSDAEILLSNYGTREDVVQEALAAWISECGSSLAPPPTLWDFIHEEA